MRFEARSGRATPSEDATGVRFTPAFRRRLESFTTRLELLRRRREGAGNTTLAGGGQEWIDLRPYRDGDDLRDLDWSLLARSDRPFVRVHRREAAERWAICVDTSASMGVGMPGKLQCAAEVAAAWLSVGLRSGAEIELLWLESGTVRARRFVRGTELSDGLNVLESLRAGGERGAAALLAEPRLAECGRHVVLGDLLDLEPRQLLAWRHRVQDVVVGQWLAQREWGRGLSGARRWRDPETGDEFEVRTDGAVLVRYEEELARLLERWRTVCGRHRVRFGCFEAGLPFEDAAHELFGI
ncbi:hypothetical protein Pla163_22570 [Planctomycetes bacterium Pla163]|uniref:DUF58 domain-containing protein n=1 Tax=Rohdeia mirabilis TaxID=2528008 RepID=A0A518D0X8_9BACT|nr:hypothetical protein Pla163_22570 [Planctomycetes bacterium Pla163]